LEETITPDEKIPTREVQDEAARVKRFLALLVRLFEGVLRYGECLQGAYKSELAQWCNS